MDVLLVVGSDPPPARLDARARLVQHVDPAAPIDAMLGALRARIPRLVGVWGPPAEAAGAAAVAAAVHRAGLPAELLSDGPVPEGLSRLLAGVEVRPVADAGPAMDVADSVVDLVGNTPMVRLDRTARDLACTLVAKLELFNPGGSSKDRIAVAMVDAAERAGLLEPGGTIVEPTSGNTGAGLAIVAARRRYRCVFVCPDKVAPDKIALLRAYGAEVVVCPTSVAPSHPESYYSVSERLAAEIPKAWKPDQYQNLHNPLAQEAAGAEIWEQTAGRVTHFVAGIGTGGTVSGVGRYLKRRNGAVRVVGADPEGSVYSGGSGRPYLVEGIGEDFWPVTYDPSVVDEVVAVSDAESFATARRVTREEGLLLGGSGGAAVAAALRAGRALGEDAVVVVHIPDSGRGYLSKLYSDSWMADHGFLRGTGTTVGDLVRSRDPTLPPLVHAHPGETVRQAIEILREYGVSQMPVVEHEPPVALAEVVGAVSERELMNRAFADPGCLEEVVGKVMEAPLPTIGAGEEVQVAVGRLERSPALLVLDGGHPVGVITRSDVLASLAASAKGPG